MEELFEDLESLPVEKVEAAEKVLECFKRTYLELAICSRPRRRREECA